MSQPRRQSLVEATANVVLGYVLAVGAQIMVFPFFGFTPGLEENLRIAAVFTVISLLRSYCLRRLFNAVGARS